MDFEDIQKIVELMDEHGLSKFKLEQDETRLELEKGGGIDVQAAQQLLAAAPAGQPAPPSQPPGPAGAQPSGVEEGSFPAGIEEITSPMVGTFYAAPSPDAEPFVGVGDEVAADTTVCIVEAMKVMNEIKAEVGGEIVEVLVENGSAVQWGEPLFQVKTA